MALLTFLGAIQQVTGSCYLVESRDGARVLPVSYTHLDVYKRQVPVTLGGQMALQLGDAGGLDQAHLRPQPQGQRLLQCTAKQWVIVGNQDLDVYKRQLPARG